METPAAHSCNFPISLIIPFQPFSVYIMNIGASQNCVYRPFSSHSWANLPMAFMMTYMLARPRLMCTAHCHPELQSFINKSKGLVFHQYLKLSISKILLITTSKLSPYLLSVNYDITLLLSKTLFIIHRQLYNWPVWSFLGTDLLSCFVAPSFTRSLMLKTLDLDFSFTTTHPRYIDFYFFNVY